MAGGGVGGGREGRVIDDGDEAKEEQMERERSASKESGYDSDGLHISEFEEDAEFGAGERRRHGSEDDWEKGNEPPIPSNPLMGRTTSVPPVPSSLHPHHAAASSESALPSIPPHNRSQSTFPSGGSSHGHGPKYSSLPTPLTDDLSLRVPAPPPSSASLPSTPPPLSPLLNDPRREQERQAMMEWLSSNDLNDYVAAFNDQQISVNTLGMLTDVDLKYLGMKKLGDRLKFNKVRPHTHTDTQHPSPHTPHPHTHSHPSTPDSAAVSLVGWLVGCAKAASDLRVLQKEERHRGEERKASAPTCEAGPNEEDIAPVAALRPQSPIEHGVRTPLPLVDEADPSDHEETIADAPATKPSKGFVHFAFLQSMPLRHSEVPGISKKVTQRPSHSSRPLVVHHHHL
jgi:hypothetical protein